jgi:hypothetical protein
VLVQAQSIVLQMHWQTHWQTHQNLLSHPLLALQSPLMLAQLSSPQELLLAFL